MTTKTTRAFRTISEAGEELGLQPHVLRFWESKFPDLNPVKRGGGRRFYRPEDIEFLRGIKVLLHTEKHPIKDVQKLIRKSGPSRVIELGRSIEKAANERSVTDMTLVPERILDADLSPGPATAAASRPHAEDAPSTIESKPAPVPVAPHQVAAPATPQAAPVSHAAPGELSSFDRESMTQSLATLEGLRERWRAFADDLASAAE